MLLRLEAAQPSFLKGRTVRVDVQFRRLVLTQPSPNSCREITFLSGRTFLCLADLLGMHPFFLFLWNQDRYCGFCAGRGIQMFSTLAGQSTLHSARSERSAKQKTPLLPFLTLLCSPGISYD